MIEATILRVDRHVMARPEAAQIPTQGKPSSIKDIGGIRIVSRENGVLKAIAKLFDGVIVTRPDGTEYKIRTPNHVSFKNEPFSLNPRETISFERRRLIRGNTQVSISNPPA